MVLYTLDSIFSRDQVVDLYSSLVWTERFTKAGDFNLVVAATPENIALLKPDVCVELQGSSEIMKIQTQLIKDGLITLTGQSLETGLNDRYTFGGNYRDRPANILGSIVDSVAIHPGSAIGGNLNKIPNLALGALDQSNDPVSIAVSAGPAYDQIQPIADTYRLGVSILVGRPDAFNYTLTFTVFKGVDRTSGQVQYNPVQFSPSLETMSNVQEVQSTASYKNVCYVFPPSWSTSTDPVVVYAPGFDPNTTGFGRRVAVVQSNASQDQVSGSVTLQSLMTQQGNDTLANNNYTKMIDGEVVPQGFVYGTDYNLGDLIELIGQSGIPQKAMVTEFIRSSDATGERAYPTVTVL